MFDEADMELDIAIDQDALDREWVKQPKLYFKYAGMLANARDKLARVKSVMEVGDAELSSDIRKSPEDFELGKVTEDAIKGAIAVNKIHKKNLSNFLDAQHSVGILEAAMWALEHRKKGLEKLVDLRLANYFSSPRASNSSREEMEDVEMFTGRKGREKEWEE